MRQNSASVSCAGRPAVCGETGTTLSRRKTTTTTESAVRIQILQGRCAGKMRLVYVLGAEKLSNQPSPELPQGCDAVWRGRGLVARGVHSPPFSGLLPNGTSHGQ